MIKITELAAKTVYEGDFQDYREMLNRLISMKLPRHFLQKTESGYKFELWGRYKNAKNKL